jgi:hypothetical protein
VLAYLRFWHDNLPNDAVLSGTRNRPDGYIPPLCKSSSYLLCYFLKSHSRGGARGDGRDRTRSGFVPRGQRHHWATTFYFVRDDGPAQPWFDMDVVG